MKMKTLLITLITGFSMLMFQPVYAASIKCGHHTISDSSRHGSDMYEVLKRCGEPSFRQGNTWIYAKGKVQGEITFNNNGSIRIIKSTR